MAMIKTTGREAARKPASEPVKPGMTHSDSMPIPKTALRTRRPGPVEPPSDEVSAQGKRRRRFVLALLILLLLLLGYWALHTFYHPAVPVDIQPPTAAPAVLPPAPATTPAPAAHTQAAAPVVTTPVVAAATAPAAVSIVDAQLAVPPTNLLEVSVGTRMRGGLTMKFDRPVSWSVLGNDGQGSVEVAVLGVRDLGTFPRNLPLPPGVKVIHAGIVEPDTLRLVFTLVPGVRAVTTPADGPATALNIFFRTAREMAALAAQPQPLQTSGGCGVAATPRTAKAMQLLQASLDRNPSYGSVRTVLTTLVLCGGDGARAEKLLADGLKGAGDPQLQLVAAAAALRFARGDVDGAVQLLKSSAGGAKADPGYAELLDDLQSATK